MYTDSYAGLSPSGCFQALKYNISTTRRTNQHFSMMDLQLAFPTGIKQAAMQHQRIIGFALPAAIFLYLSTVILYRLYLHPLRKVPGPSFAALSDWYAAYLAWKGDQHIAQYRLHLEYGPIVRLQPDRVIVQDPFALPLIYHRNADKPWGWYGPFHGVETVHSMTKHDDHTRRKRSVLPAYGSQAVKSQLLVIDRVTTLWFAHLEQSTSASSTIDLADEVMHFSRDLWMDIVFGRRLGFIEKGDDVQGLHVFDMRYRAVMEIMAFVPSFKKLVMGNALLRYLLVPPEDPNHGDGWIYAAPNALSDHSCRTSTCFGFSSDLRQNSRRFYQSEKRNDPASATNDQRADQPITHRFLAMGLDQESFASEVRAMVGAASGPLGSALTECILNIIDHPNSMPRIDQELTFALQQRGFTSPLQLFTSQCDLATTLPYFDACLRETLRGSEVSTFMYPREIQAAGVTLCGQYIPPGCSAASTPWVVARSHEIYGVDADVYRPERWLEADVETRKEWRKWDFTFGYGARNCLGRQFAETILWRVALLFLAKFQVARASGNKSGVQFVPREAEGKHEADDHMVRLVGRKTFAAGVVSS